MTHQNSDAKANIPKVPKKLFRKILRKFWYYGSSRYCPCCKSSLRKFKPYGVIKRSEAKCPICKSLERHRLIYLYFTEKTNLLEKSNKKLLHIAPEKHIAQFFQKEDHLDYLSADLRAPEAMVEMDITNIQYPDNSFDIIYCSHVLEHVPEDRKAMNELQRVLKPGGWAILQVPIKPEPTLEDPSITSPEDREKYFGDSDHVRQYGPDYKDRLSEAGFSVTVDGFAREMGENNATRYGLMADEDVYLCRKAA